MPPWPPGLALSEKTARVHSLVRGTICTFRGQGMGGYTSAPKPDVQLYAHSFILGWGDSWSYSSIHVHVDHLYLLLFWCWSFSRLKASNGKQPYKYSLFWTAAQLNVYTLVKINQLTDAETQCQIMWFCQRLHFRANSQPFWIFQQVSHFDSWHHKYKKTFSLAAPLNKFTFDVQIWCNSLTEETLNPTSQCHSRTRPIFLRSPLLQ